MTSSRRNSNASSSASGSGIELTSRGQQPSATSESSLARPAMTHPGPRITLGFVTRKGKVDGLAPPPDPEKPNNNNPMPPITQFTPDPRLRKAFYGIDYNPAKTLMPWCGVTLQNVVDDVILMSQLTTRIRLYGMDCAQADLTFQAITALKLNRTMKVVLTLWVDKNSTTYQRQYDTLLKVLDTHGTDMIQGISVGNEVLFRNDTSLESLGVMMNNVRTTIRTRYNKNIPVFTSEIGNNLNANLAAISDELSGNLHPYFAGTAVAEAAKWTMGQYNDTLLAYPTSSGLKGAISEVGWPSAPASAVYQTYAVPGLANLQTMVDTFVCQANAAGISYYWFEFKDEPWKNDPKVPVEAHWGIFDQAGNLKIKIPDCIAASKKKAGYVRAIVDIATEEHQSLPDSNSSALHHRVLARIPTASSIYQSKSHYSLIPTGHNDDPDCPELPSTPSWSLSSIMERRDAHLTSPDHSNDITPETINHLLNLAHLCKPKDPVELQRLERDVRRMKNFLDYIQSCDTSHERLATDRSKTVESLRSLVDDRSGLRLRPTVSAAADKGQDNNKEKEREAIRRREVLLERPSRVKGNFFVVGTELDKDDN
ncbi:hypothetical protein BGX28_006493 [Mortierella sp. GBA30]|nr:hypothetical protein BGX28_006493 [Mortierella sp. GBA30]